MGMDSEYDELDAMWSDSDDDKKKKKKKGKKGKKGKNYEEDKPVFKTGEWSQDEKQKLTELLQKWPAGTPNRMSRLSEELLRSEADLSKQLKVMRSIQNDTKKHVTSSDDGWSQEQQKALEEALKVYTKD